MIDQGIDVINQVIDKLFGKFDSEFNRKVGDLCGRMPRNELGQKAIGFIHDGKWFVDPGSAQSNRKNSPRHALPAHLLPEMDSMLKERELIRSEQKQINQLLVKLLYQCNEQREIRDALPDCLWVYAGFSSHCREFSQEHFFFGDHRVERDFARLLPRIEYYLGMSLIL